MADNNITKHQSHQEAIFNCEELVEWGGILNEVLWVCAGVNRKVLRQCPTDYAKYAGIGGTILFTAIMAWISASYALYSVFERQWIAISFGLVWGMLIFNLDRFIVNTMYSDGKVSISWSEFRGSIPRLIIAIFLGVVISTPLELKIFEDAIDIRIEQDKEALLNKRVGSQLARRDSIAQKRDAILNGVATFDVGITTSSISVNRTLSEISELQKIANDYSTQNQQIQNRIQELRQRLSNTELDSEQQRLRNQIGELYRRKNEVQSKYNGVVRELRDKQGEAAASDATLKGLLNSKQDATNKEAERLRLEIESLDSIIREANIRHWDWNEEEIKARGSFRDKLEVEYKGFQAKMHAFSELRDENPSTNFSAWVIMFLFIIVETTPTFFKMMIASGPYDDLLRAEMHRVRVLSEKRISDVNDVVNTEVTISVEKNKARLEAELLANQELLDSLSKAQNQLLQEAIEKWREEELSKIKQDHSNYIKTI